MFAPAKTPPAVIERLHHEIARVLHQPAVRERLFNVGVEAVGSTRQQLGEATQSEMARYGKVIRDGGIRDM